MLGFCRLANFLTAVCALLCAVAHGMALMVGEGSVQVMVAYGRHWLSIAQMQLQRLNALLACQYHDVPIPHNA